MIKKYLLSSVAFIPEGKSNVEQKKEPTEAEKRQAERDAIKVETNQKEQDEKDKEIKDKEDGEQEETEEEGEEKEDDADADNDADSEAKENEPEEDKEEKLEAEKLAAKSQKDKDRIQKRIDKEVAKRKKLEDENAELRRKLDAKPDAEKTLTEEDVEALSEKKANAKQLQREFVNSCNRLAKSATSVDKDFKKKIDEVTEDYAPIPTVMVAILDDMDNGGELLAYLANNPEEYEKVHELSEGKMGRELQKLSIKIEEDKKPKPKKISKAPEPTKPIGGNRQSPNVLTGKEDMETFVKIRARQTEERRKQKMMQ